MELLNRASYQMNMQNLGHHTMAFDMPEFKVYVQVQIKWGLKSSLEAGTYSRGSSDKYESNTIHMFWLQGKFNAIWQAYTVKLFPSWPKVHQRTILGKKAQQMGGPILAIH